MDKFRRPIWMRQRASRFFGKALEMLTLRMLLRGRR